MKKIKAKKLPNNWQVDRRFANLPKNLVGVPDCSHEERTSDKYELYSAVGGEETFCPECTEYYADNGKFPE